MTSEELETIITATETQGLTELSFKRVEVTDENLIHLAEQHQRLARVKVLELYGYGQYSDVGVQALVERFTQLTSLSLGGIGSDLTDNTVRVIVKRLPNLTA